MILDCLVPASPRGNSAPEANPSVTADVEFSALLETVVAELPTAEAQIAESLIVEEPIPLEAEEGVLELSAELLDLAVDTPEVEEASHAPMAFFVPMLAEENVASEATEVDLVELPQLEQPQTNQDSPLELPSLDAPKEQIETDQAEVVMPPPVLPVKTEAQPVATDSEVVIPNVIEPAIETAQEPTAVTEKSPVAPKSVMVETQSGLETEQPDFALHLRETEAPSKTAQIEAAPRTEVKRADLPPLVRNVLDRMEEVQISEGQTRVLLRPQGLGLLEIDLSRMIDGRLQLTLRAENPIVLAAMQNESAEMTAFLQDRGFDLSGGQPQFSSYNRKNETENGMDNSTLEDEVEVDLPDDVLSSEQINIVT